MEQYQIQYSQYSLNLTIVAYWSAPLAHYGRPLRCILTVQCLWCVQTTIDSVLEDWSWLLSFVSLASPFYSVREANTHTHTHTHTLTGVHTQSCVHTQKWIHTYMYSSTHTKLCTHTHTHTHTTITFTFVILFVQVTIADASPTRTRGRCPWSSVILQHVAPDMQLAHVITLWWDTLQTEMKMLKIEKGFVGVTSISLPG